ncbi:hypothetical protein [Streptomyces sp. NPDC001450]
MAVDQLPGRVREFANYLDGLLGRLDQGGGWCGVFWQRDPEGMRACLDGGEVPPWDVVEALLQDLHAAFGPAAAAAERERARVLHAAAVSAYDARPGARNALGDRLDVMLREQRYAAERQAELSRLLTEAPSSEEADALRLDLAWAQDDHERAAARCAELRARLAKLDRRAVEVPLRGASEARGEGAGGVPGPEGVPATTEGHGAAAGAFDGATGTDDGGRSRGPRAEDLRGGGAVGGAGGSRASGGEGFGGAVRAVGDGGPGVSGAEGFGGAAVVGGGGVAAPGEAGAPGAAWHGAGSAPFRPHDARVADHDGRLAAFAGDGRDPWASRTHEVAPGPAPAAPTPEAPTPAKPRKRRRGSARFAGMVEDAGAPVVVPQAPVAAVPEVAGGRRSPRGARFAGAAEGGEVVEGPVEAVVDAEAGAVVVGVVEQLVRLRAEGRTGEAHVLLVDIARWPAARFPLLADRLQRAGLAADWATLLWEAASLPAERLVAAADALEAAGRPADGQQMLRQGVARPAEEIGAAVLGLDTEGRGREVRALLDAYVRVRTPEEAARSAGADPRRLVPLLLEAARGVSEERHWDLVHALRVAGFTA